jgi:muramoyltetrapeptide carboxypeptidase
MGGWKPLQKGDLVDLIAPGYAVEPDKVQSGVRALEAWGLRVRSPEELIRPFYFHAQTDEKRLAFTQKAFFAKDSAAVWSVRGGYGSNRLIPGLLKKKAPARAKLFVGISDVTTLHLLLNQNWKWPSLHGPLLDRLGSGTLPPEFSEECRALVFGELREARFAGLEPMNAAAMKRKKIEGRVVGGNLTVLQSALSTRIQPKLKDRILFLEDIGERGYRIDRMLEQFKQAGLFEKCAAVVFGHFLGGQEPNLDGASYIPFALERFAEQIQVPVWQGLPVGHGEHQRALPLGTPAVLQKNTLTVASGAL